MGENHHTRGGGLEGLCPALHLRLLCKRRTEHVLPCGGGGRGRCSARSHAHCASVCGAVSGRGRERATERAEAQMPTTDLDSNLAHALSGIKSVSISSSCGGAYIQVCVDGWGEWGREGARRGLGSLGIWYVEVREAGGERGRELRDTVVSLEFTAIRVPKTHARFRMPYLFPLFAFGFAL
eukprot:562796-Pleurochrysis_carterae.AAC.1